MYNPTQNKSNTTWTVCRKQEPVRQMPFLQWCPTSPRVGRWDHFREASIRIKDSSGCPSTPLLSHRFLHDLEPICGAFHFTVLQDLHVMKSTLHATHAQ